MELLQTLCCLFPMGTSAFRGDYSLLHATNTKWSNMSCEECNQKFNFLRRKKTCSDCGHNFCMSCIKKMSGVEKPVQCHRCRVFCSVPLEREVVTGLRVKDLRWFLETNRIPSHGCKEKQDLVDLVMHHAVLRNASSAYPQNYERHTMMPEFSGSEQQKASSVSTSQDSSPMFPHHDLVPRPAEYVRNVQVHEVEADDFTLISLPGGNESLPNDVEDQSSEQQQESESKSDKNSDEQAFAPLTINDITSVDKISDLSVMQLKLILTRNFIGFKGCCEKQELQTKVRQLWEQKQESKNIGDVPDENLCKICMEAAIDSVLLDCGHVLTCTDCGKRLNECPICRQYVVRVVHIFKA